MGTLQVSVVVPLFDEEGNLAPLTAEIEQALRVPGREFELVFVNDGSNDRSLDELRDLALSRPHLRIINLARNCGQSAALAAGFRAARGEIVVTLDADLQNDPADIPLLLDALDDWDVVSGVRLDRKDTWKRRLASSIANRIRNLVLRDGVSDVGCSLNAYRADFLRDLPSFDGMHRFLPALLKMRGARLREIAVRHRPRRHGRSKYGINDRLWRGIADLVGVRWLQSRWIDARLAQEIEIWKPIASSGSRSGSSDRPSSLPASSYSGSSLSAEGRASSPPPSGS
jgi:glycosyltransferase involved in cell wall biosynthesis